MFAFHLLFQVYVSYVISILRFLCYFKFMFHMLFQVCVSNAISSWRFLCYFKFVFFMIFQVCVFYVISSLRFLCIFQVCVFKLHGKPTQVILTIPKPNIKPTKNVLLEFWDLYEIMSMVYKQQIHTNYFIKYLLTTL